MVFVYCGAELCGFSLIVFIACVRGGLRYRQYHAFNAEGAALGRVTLCEIKRQPEGWRF